MINPRRPATRSADFAVAGLAQSGDMSAIDYLIILYRQKWIVLSVLVLCMMLAYTLSRVMAPKYEAVIVMVPTKDDTSSTSSNPLVSSFLPNLRAEQNERRDMALAALDSRSFLEGFISEHGLLPLLFPEQWDDGAHDWRADAKVPTLEQGYARLHGAIRVETSTANNVVKFVVKWRDSKLAADWANGLIAKVNGMLREREIATADNMISYLNKAYAQTTVGDVRVSIANLIEQEIKQRTVAQGKEDFALDVISPAEPTAFPAGPGLTVLLAGGLLLGLVLGIPLAFLRQSFVERRVEGFVRLPAAAPGE